MRRGLARGLIFGFPLSFALWGAIATIGGCVPSHVNHNEPAYEVCHTDNCGDSVDVVVTNRTR